MITSYDMALAVRLRVCVSRQANCLLLVGLAIFTEALPAVRVTGVVVTVGGELHGENGSDSYLRYEDSSPPRSIVAIFAAQLAKLTSSMKRTLFATIFLLGASLSTALFAQTLTATRTTAGEGPAQQTISLGEVLFVEISGDDQRYAGELVKLENQSLTLSRRGQETTYALSELTTIGIKKKWLTTLRAIGLPGMGLGAFMLVAGPISYFTSTSAYRGLDLVLIPLGLGIGGIASIPFWIKRPQFPADSFRYTIQ
ncbi:MAG: hypothetical protein AAFQ98_13775 [Bacteroidota bacterium]